MFFDIFPLSIFTLFFNINPKRVCSCMYVVKKVSNINKNIIILIDWFLHVWVWHYCNNILQISDFNTCKILINVQNEKKILEHNIFVYIISPISKTVIFNSKWERCGICFLVDEIWNKIFVWLLIIINDKFLLAYPH